MKTGIIVESFKTDYESAIKLAKEMGFEGIQFYGNFYSPDKTALPVSAVCAEIEGDSFETYNVQRIAKTKEIMLLAKKLGTNIVTTHIGVVDMQNQDMRACLEEIGAFGEEIGVSLAIETGPEKATQLKEFIESLKTKNIGVNLDGANLVMVTDDDPVEAVYTLREYILHVHIKDGVMLKKTEPKIIYDFFASGGIGDLRLDEYFKETPLGEGNVDLKGMINALKDIGYDGYLTIERETSDTPMVDITRAKDYLDELMK
ncbi:MAG: sugar phosphate isomerase/epimerase [Clostridia bacterium]|nr:sugar phosphate isomerase/epimerase [Clostridia bacterium]